MSNEVMDEEVVAKSQEEQTDATASITLVETTFEKFLETADVKKAFGEPIENGESIIIPAAEVVTSMGFGIGFGSSSNEGGGGGGGGGHTFSRPVAVVIATASSVRVEPVVDVTKIALAFFTAFGFIVTNLIKMSRGK